MGVVLTNPGCAKNRNLSTITVSRLTLASCLAQLFDYSGRHLALCRVYLKTALRRHVQGGGTQWDSAITGSNLDLFYSALRCFYMVRQIGLPKCNFYLSPLAGYYLICSCDGSPDLSSISVSLVSFLNFQTYKAKAMHLSLSHAL